MATPVADDTAGRAGDLPDRRHRAGHEDQKHAPVHGVRREVLLGDLVLALAALAVDDRDPVCLGPGPQEKIAIPLTEPVSHAPPKQQDHTKADPLTKRSLKTESVDPGSALLDKTVLADELGALRGCRTFMALYQVLSVACSADRSPWRRWIRVSFSVWILTGLMLDTGQGHPIRMNGALLRT